MSDRAQVKAGARMRTADLLITNPDGGRPQYLVQGRTVRKSRLRVPPLPSRPPFVRRRGCQNGCRTLRTELLLPTSKSGRARLLTLAVVCPAVFELPGASPDGSTVQINRARSASARSTESGLPRSALNESSASSGFSVFRPEVETRYQTASSISSGRSAEFFGSSTQRSSKTRRQPGASLVLFCRPLNAFGPCVRCSSWHP